MGPLDINQPRVLAPEDEWVRAAAEEVAAITATRSVGATVIALVVSAVWVAMRYPEWGSAVANSVDAKDGEAEEAYAYFLKLFPLVPLQGEGS